MAHKKRKRKSEIRDLNDLRREKAKAEERLNNTQSLIEEDWYALQAQFKPSALVSMADRFVPFLGNLLPMGRVISNLFGSFKRQRKAEPEANDDDQRDNTNTNKSKSGRFFLRVLLPFLTGATAVAGLMGRRANK
jgi:hypothetical protein